MTGGALFGSVLLTAMFPGFAQGLAFRRNRMIGFATAAIVTTVAILWSVWFVPVTLAVRIAAANDAYLLLRRHTPPGNRVLAAIAVVIGAVTGGTYSFALEGFAIPSSSMYPTIVIGDRVFVDKLTPRWRPIERGEIIVFDQPCAKRPYIKRVIAVGGDTVEVRCSRVYVNGTAIAEQLIEPHARYTDYEENSGEWFSRSASRYRETHGGHAYEVFHADDRAARAGEHDFPKRDRMFAPSCQQSDFYAPAAGVPKQPIGTLAVTKADAQPCEPQAHYVVPANALFVMGDNRNNANDSRYWGAVSVDAVIGRAIGIYYSHPPRGDVQWGRFGAVK